MSKVKTYIETQLGASGFVLINPEVAFRIRRDIWATSVNCASDFSDPSIKRLLAERCDVIFRFEGQNIQGYGGAFSMYRLKERLAELYGVHAEVTAVAKDKFLEAEAPTTAPETPVTRRQQERLAKDKELAAMSLRTHSCPLNDQILAARARLGVA